MTVESRLMAALQRAQAMKAFAVGEGGFFELMDMLEEEWLTQWRKTAVDDVEKRETIYAHIKVLGALRQMMSTIISDEKISQAELDRLKRIETGEEVPSH